jgi:IS30 family transposase|tara:strand:+ start:80 stop:1078 length:999 start_codon:yes stop_codon:yes gene_type:complete
MSYVHLSLQERYVIHHLKLMKLSNREIGRRLGRHHTTIGREVGRNGPLRSGLGPYWHEVAQRRAEARWRFARHHRRAANGGLRRTVVHQLGLNWSPEQIAGRLMIDHTDDPGMRISPETIYQWVYEDAATGGALYRCLRRSHPKRRRQRRTGSGRGQIPGRIGIDRRPEIVSLRGRFGDWEADTLEGAKGRGGIASHVERKSRYLVTAKLEDKKAATFAHQTIHAFRRIPRAWRHTMTADNGKEFTQFKWIERAIGLSVFFADPYAPWQRGTNENTNGLLRQYFPKGRDLGAVSSKTLAKATKSINHRPRKCLGYQTPHEVLMNAPRGALPT